ncbi:hypothetical protein [Metabacillus sp. 84]|uniref:hypothetical protein n=1 Tax=Metabacillus sp. 84 TaxID=3404705 RepID=UPI003CF97E6F
MWTIWLNLDDEGTIISATSSDPVLLEEATGVDWSKKYTVSVEATTEQLETIDLYKYENGELVLL